MMTLEQLAADAPRIVGLRPDPRWRRSSEHFVRSDGVSRKIWFERNPAGVRVKLVRESLLEGKPWSSLVRIHLPKYGTSETRPIDIPTIRDQARLYPMQDWLSEYAERLLCARAVAFRRHRSTVKLIRAVKWFVSNGYCWAAVVDVQNYFGSLSWSRLDALIESLPADKAVQGLLKALVRVRVVDQVTGAPVPGQGRGIPQGLSVSPTLANLYLAEWDRHVNHALSHLGAMLLRYCDDLLILARTREGAEQSVTIVQDRLRHRGLSAKPGHGAVVDLGAAAVRWLKLDFSLQGIEAPAEVLQWKVAGYHDKFDRGLFTTTDGMDQSIVGLESYYKRILPAPRAREVSGILRTGTRDLFDRLSLSGSIHNPSPTERSALLAVTHAEVI
jgi:retron-type reverse transcriptase